MVSQAILDSVLQLSEADRLLIVKRLLETLPDSIATSEVDDDEYFAELKRRSGDLEGAVSWADLKASLQAEQ
jgi:hypothetical protein